MLAAWGSQAFLRVQIREGRRGLGWGGGCSSPVPEMHRGVLAVPVAARGLPCPVLRTRWLMSTAAQQRAAPNPPFSLGANPSLAEKQI